MGQKTTRALAAIQEAITEQASEIAEHDVRINRLEKIVQAQAQDIATMERSVQDLRDRSIRAAIDRGVPTKVVAEAHGLTSGRVSQIAPRKNPPLC